MNAKIKADFAIPKEVLEELDQKSQAEITNLWEKVPTSARRTVSVTDKETEAALHHVRHRMNGSVQRGQQIIRFINQNSKYAAAALFLIAVSSFFILVPKTIVVPHGEIAKFELPDGSAVEMNSGTTLSYSRLFKFTNRNAVLNGEAFFSVAKGTHPFIVQANGAAIEVTGTRFNVRSWPEDPSSEIAVTVTEGTVLFYPENQQEHSVSLSEGQASYWKSGSVAPSPAADTEIDDAIAWREQRFVFRNRTVGSIIKELERRYDTQIELRVRDDISAIETLTAYYSSQVQLESILEDICMVKGLRYTQTANGYRIFE